MGAKILKRKAPASRIELPPPKHRKSRKSLVLQIEKLEKEVFESKRKLKELEDRFQENEQASDVSVSMLLSTIATLDIPKEIPNMENKLPPILLSGIFLCLNSLENRVSWYRTRNPQLHVELWLELMPLLEIPPQSKVTPELLLDLIFFVFSTGLSMVDVSKVFFVDGVLVSVSTLYRWFDMTIDSLSKWGRKQIYFLLDEEWLFYSSKIFENEEFKRYENILFYFVDGTIIEVQDTSDPLMSQTLRNGKHGCPAIVFFIMVAPGGIVTYLCEEFSEGCMHDKTHFNSDGTSRKLQEFYSTATVTINGKEFQRELGGDKAYPHAEKPPGWKWRITKSGEHTEDVTPEGKEIHGTQAKQMTKKNQLENVIFDPGFARLRSVVERAIGRIKSWPVFSSPSFCSNLQRTVDMVTFSVGLSNWFMRKTNTKQI